VFVFFRAASAQLEDLPNLEAEIPRVASPRTVHLPKASPVFFNRKNVLLPGAALFLLPFPLVLDRGKKWLTDDQNVLCIVEIR